jgi:serine/threonine protein kinase
MEHAQATAAGRESLAAAGIDWGELIGGAYRLEGILGIGGMGTVALAFDVKLERQVAIKFVNPAMFIVPETHGLFCEEARAMARLSHANVLAIHALGDHGRHPYIVMEYVDGFTVSDWLRDRPAGTLPTTDEVLRVLEQTCRGVEAIHASGTVHRDLKPSNLLIDRQFRVAVADFGLSCLEGKGGGAQNIAIGTAAYMAPESAFGEATSFDYARDIYALGCIAYELFVGQPPFTGESGLNVLAQHVVATPDLPSLRNRDLGTAYDGVLLQALAKEPQSRQASVAAFREGLVRAHRAATAPERILVADDDEDWRDLTVARLRERFPKAVIDAVADGLSALDAFCNEPYAAVLVDLEMPEMDGGRLIRSLRSIAGARRTAIVVLTAAGGSAEWKRLSAAGADAFLIKPVHIEDVEVAIRRSLRRRREPQ